MCAKHKGKGLIIKVDLCCYMQESKCEENTDFHAHLETMAQMHEELASMGEHLTVKITLPFSSVLCQSPMVHF
jgi:3-phosphoglycerate kinase